MTISSPNKLKVKLDGIRRYSFKDDNSGRQVEGTTCYYTMPTPVLEADQKGFIQSKSSLPIQAYETLRNLEFPCECYVDIEQSLGAKGIVNKVVGFTPVNAQKTN